MAHTEALRVGEIVHGRAEAAGLHVHYLREESGISKNDIPGDVLFTDRIICAPSAPEFYPVELNNMLRGITDDLKMIGSTEDGSVARFEDPDHLALPTRRFKQYLGYSNIFAQSHWQSRDPARSPSTTHMERERMHSGVCEVLVVPSLRLADIFVANATAKAVVRRMDVAGYDEKETEAFQKAVREEYSVPQELKYHLGLTAIPRAMQRTLRIA